jgi:hypothetical protein
MFEEILLGGGGERRIALETRSGRPIENTIEPEPGDRERRLYEVRRNRFGAGWFNRKPPCGVYNCYGMLFASRRTSILADVQIPDILRDDGFRRIPETEAVVGDVVLYREKTAGLLHAARITRKDELRALYALSKWDSAMGEDEHHVRHHCWLDYDVEMEFWTDRP